MKFSLIALAFMIGRAVAAEPDCAATYGIVPIGTDPDYDPKDCIVCDEGRECIELLTGLPCDNTAEPSGKPSDKPSSKPSATPSGKPSTTPSGKPSASPTGKPSASPSGKPSSSPSSNPSSSPSKSPSSTPSADPSSSPTSTPSANPSASPTKAPTTAAPTEFVHPTQSPTVSPKPSAKPSGKPSSSPSDKPSAAPSVSPSNKPSTSPSKSPSANPSATPSVSPSAKPSVMPSANPTAVPTGQGERSPSETPSETPTKAPVIPIEECPEKAFDICIAIDYSGSVCTKSGEAPQNCYPTDNNPLCDMDLGSPDRCSNFLETKDFATSFINAVGGVGSDTKQFSLVTFSDVSRTRTVSGLTDPASAAGLVDGIAYEGGWTNTGGAINACYETLKNSDKEKVIVLMTDGTPTTGDSNPLGYAQREAFAAMKAGILMLPMYINTVSRDLINMRSFTNDPANVIEVGSFQELPDALDDLVSKIDCDEPELTFEPADLVDPCSNTLDDFSEDGFAGWIVDGGAGRYPYQKTIGNIDVEGSLYLQGVHSDTHITKNFDDEIAAMTTTTQVTVKFNACYQSVESYHHDDLYVGYNTGDGWVELKKYASGALSYGSNTGCYEGEELSFTVAPEVSTLELRFYATGGHSSDLYFITDVDTDICEPTVALDECPDQALDVCIAIDYSGSVCTKPNPNNNAYNCYPSSQDSNCDRSLGEIDWCPNFRETKSFVDSVIAKIDEVGDNKQFSVVTFSDESKTVKKTDLTSAGTARGVVSNVEYLGGWTNTGGAIKACRNTLSNSNNDKVIVLVTDGQPTTGTGSGSCSGKTNTDYARCEAEKSWADGILVLPMYINTVSTNTGNMKDFANNKDESLVVAVTSFGELPTALVDLVDKINCDGVPAPVS